MATKAPRPPGRPRGKPCAWEGCAHVAKGDNRYCSRHGAYILSRLRGPAGDESPPGAERELSQ